MIRACTLDKKSRLKKIGGMGVTSIHLDETGFSGRPYTLDIFAKYEKSFVDIFSGGIQIIIKISYNYLDYDLSFLHD